MTPNQRKQNPEFVPVVVDFDDKDFMEYPERHFVTLYGPERKLYFYVEMDGPTKILCVSEYPNKLNQELVNIEERLKKISEKIKLFSDDLDNTGSSPFDLT